MDEYCESLIMEAERISKKSGLKELLQLGILNINILKKWLVKELYYEAMKKGDKTCISVKYELSDEYNLSISQIEKLVYRT